MHVREHAKSKSRLWIDECRQFDTSIYICVFSSLRCLSIFFFFFFLPFYPFIGCWFFSKKVLYFIRMRWKDECQNKCWMFCSVCSLPNWWPNFSTIDFGILNRDEISDAIIVICVHSSMEIWKCGKKCLPHLHRSFWAFCLAVIWWRRFMIFIFYSWQTW